MSRPTCTDASCERAVVRYRAGAGFCMFHPDAAPPVMDPKTGRPVIATPSKRKADIDPDLELQAELDELERTDPDVAAASASYDAMVDRVRTRSRAGLPTPPRSVKPGPTEFDKLYADAAERAKAVGAQMPDDGVCVTEGCARPWRHRGRHGRPKVEPVRPDDGVCETTDCQRPWHHRGRHGVPKPAIELVRPDDGLCTVDGCDRTWRHNGRHRLPESARPPRPRPARPVEPGPVDGLCDRAGCTMPWRHKGRHTEPVDHALAAARYVAGEGLFALAADLHIGTVRLREILHEQGVELRKRGRVIGRRGPEPRPIDVDECKRLYIGGMDARAIATHLHVKARRVYDVLRAEGVLGPPGGREPGPGSINSVRVKLAPDEVLAVRGRAATLGLSINAYLRGVVLADLAPADEAGAA